MLITDKEIINKIFNIAYEQNIEIYMAAFSELSINFIVDKDKSEQLIKKLNDELIEKD